MAGEDLLAADFTDETDSEREARIDTEVVLDEADQEFVKLLVDKLMTVCDELSGHPFYPYQKPLARRIFESLIINDGATISALWARQSGKTEDISNCVATAMIMLPRLAKIFPTMLGKYKEGVWVGAFAPVDTQAENLFGRIVSRLTSEQAEDIMGDPEINDKVVGRGRKIRLASCGSMVRQTTCHPRATIEGASYHIILVDESQFADDYVINKSVAPMGAATRATMIFTGTSTRNKNVFYRIIQKNKRMVAGRARQNHFEVDWKTAGKYNLNYKKFVQGEMLRLGEDSDEFKLSYRCLWLLEQGMFTTSEKLDALGDTSMQSVVHAYSKTPVVVGVDCGRKHDRTVVTVVFVDWDNPDQFGLYHHRILSWLDLEGMDWEEQYFRIVEFLSNYNVWKVAVDVGGLGDVVAQRLRLLLPYAEVVGILSTQSDQSKRWKHLSQLMDRQQIAWPAGAKVRRLKTYRRFRQEMEDLELHYKGPFVLAEAPGEADAHDDYPDSLALACILTFDEGENTVEQYDNLFYR
jgi:terminase large subunit-like protein